MERRHHEQNQHRNRFEPPTEVPAEGAFVQRLPQNPSTSVWNPRRSVTPSPPPSRVRRDLPVIEDLTKIVLPLLFTLHFAITGGIVLNYTLSLNRTLPRKYTIGAAITFGVLILLEIVGATVLYFQRRCDTKRYGVAQRNNRVARDVEGGGGSRSGSPLRGRRGNGKGPELARGRVIAGDRWWQRAWEWLKECYEQKLCFHCGFGLDKLTAGQVNGSVDGPAASVEISTRVLEQGEQHSNEAPSAPPQPAVDLTIVNGSDLEKQEQKMLQEQTRGIRQKNRLTEYHPPPHRSVVAITRRSLSERRQRHILSPPAKSKSLNNRHPSRKRVMSNYSQHPPVPGDISLAAKLLQEDMEIKLSTWKQQRANVPIVHQISHEHASLTQGECMQMFPSPNSGFRSGSLKSLGKRSKSTPDRATVLARLRQTSKVRHVQRPSADLTFQELYEGKKLKRVGTIGSWGGSTLRSDSHRRHDQGTMDEELSEVSTLTGERTSDLDAVELLATSLSPTPSRQSLFILPDVGQGLAVGQEQIDDLQDDSSLRKLQREETAGIYERRYSATLNRSETKSTLHIDIHGLDGVEVLSNNVESTRASRQNSTMQERADSPTLGSSPNKSAASADSQALSRWICSTTWPHTTGQRAIPRVNQEVCIDGPRIEEMDAWEDSNQDSDEWEDVEPVYELEAPSEGYDAIKTEKSVSEEEATELVLLPSKHYEFPHVPQKKKHESTEVCLDAELVTLFDAADKYMEAGYRDNVIKNILR